MLPLIEFAVILSCVLSLIGLFFRLRDHVCPHCQATGSLTTIELVRDEDPQLGVITTIRTRRCGGCGAVITDRRYQPIAAKPTRRRIRQRARWRLRHLPRPFPAR